MTVEFTQSIHCSGEFICKDTNKTYCQNMLGKCFFTENEYNKLDYRRRKSHKIERNENYKVPDIYSVLCSLIRYEVGTFENFCDEFGYDTDSIKANEIYKAVEKQYAQELSVFSDDDFALIQLIN